MDVKLEIDFRARFYQAARAFRKYITFLTDGIFIQEDTLFAYGEGAVCRVEFAAIDASITWLDDGRSDVVNRRESLGRNDLDALQVTILRQMRIDEDVRPLIGRLSFDNVVLRQRHDDIRLTDLPGFDRGKLEGRRHFRRVSLRRAVVDPLRDFRDFFVRQRNVIAETLNPDVLVDEPRRHLPRGNLLLDRPGPWPRLLVSHQRHRRERARVMT